MYRIDPDRTDLAEEFRANPFGPHSAELQKMLNVMRWEPIEGKYVLVNTVPHREWCLAQLPARRGIPVNTPQGRDLHRSRRSGMAYLQASMEEAHRQVSRRGLSGRNPSTTARGGS